MKILHPIAFSQILQKQPLTSYTIRQVPIDELHKLQEEQHRLHPIEPIGVEYSLFYLWSTPIYHASTRSQQPSRNLPKSCSSLPGLLQEMDELRTQHLGELSTHETFSLQFVTNFWICKLTWWFKKWNKIFIF